MTPEEAIKKACENPEFLSAIDKRIGMCNVVINTIENEIIVDNKKIVLDRYKGDEK